MTPEEDFYKTLQQWIDFNYRALITSFVMIFVLIILAVCCSCSSYEVVKKTQTKHMRYEPTKERHGGGKTTLE